MRASDGRRRLYKGRFLIEREKMMTTISSVNYLSGRLIPLERDTKGNRRSSRQGHLAKESWGTEPQGAHCCYQNQRDLRHLRTVTTSSQHASVLGFAQVPPHLELSTGPWEHAKLKTSENRSRPRPLHLLGVEGDCQPPVWVRRFSGWATKKKRRCYCIFLPLWVWNSY